MKPSEMMDMLHAIREKHYKQVKRLSQDERVAEIRKEAARVQKKMKSSENLMKVQETPPVYRVKDKNKSH